jgi:hypothetical protein
VVRTERCFADDQHSLEEFPRLAVLPLVSIHVAQIVENLPHIGVIRTERLLADDQGALEEPSPAQLVKADVGAISRQVEVALLYDGKLDVTRMPPE